MRYDTDFYNLREWMRKIIFLVIYCCMRSHKKGRIISAAFTKFAIERMHLEEDSEEKGISMVLKAIRPARELSAFVHLLAPLI